MKEKQYIPDYSKQHFAIESTKDKKGMTKAQIISEIAGLCNTSKVQVRDILDAFTDIAIREQVTNGVFKWPGLPTVTRQARKKVKRYLNNIDKTIEYPETSYLTARVGALVKRMHRNMYREQNNTVYGTTHEDWWKPFYYCDGDWRKKEKTNEE